MAEDMTGFNDPIHGYMEFDPLLVDIIHTPCFQRMKDIKQMGVSYWVFPGASHNRFEHSLGTAHLAGMMIERLRDIHKKDNYITDEDVLCVKIAALCHDLGHGPFSHMFDTRMKKKLIEYHQSEIKRLSDEQCEYADKEKSIAEHSDIAKKLEGWGHEDASCDMFDYMLKTSDGLARAFEKRNLGENKQKLIKDLIKGKNPASATDNTITEIATVDGKLCSKWFLFEIVANKIYEVDCDKFDYFARDCHNLGMKSNFDHLRYIHNIRILRKDDELHLSPRDKLSFNMYELFHTRWSLHHRACQHKTTNAIEDMITDALVLLEWKYKFSEAIFDMEKYSKLTDSIFYEILRSNDKDDKTKKAQEILERVQRRKLYKFYDQFQPAKKVEIDGLKAAEEIASLSEGRLDPNEIFVNFVDIHYGKKDEDPVESALFHKKHSEKLYPIRKDEVSRMLPKNFSEQYVYLYGKDLPTGNVKKEISEKCFKSWGEKYKSNAHYSPWPAVAAIFFGGVGILKYLLKKA